MRALVPLVTAGALAVTGWLASGVVTVRSIEQPARIGLLPPPATVVLLLLPLLVLAGASVVSGRRPRAMSMVAIAAVAAPIVLPWLPVSWPVAVLIWTGPLAIGWWLVTVSYACCGGARAVRGTAPTHTTTPASDTVHVRIAGAWARIASAFSTPSRAPVVAAVLTGLLLTAAAWHTRSQHPRGDEPDYLVITQSLLLDGDLRIENNHRRGDYAAYHPDALPPSYLQRGADGAIYSVHAPGLPVLLASAFAVAGYRGAVATLIVIAMAGAWLAWRSAWDITRDARASWFGTLATVGAAPFFLHGAAIFPDAPASVLASLVVWRLLRGGSPSPVPDAIALGLLPWLHTRYAILSVGLGVIVLASLLRGASWRRIAAFVVPAASIAIAWFGSFYAIYGTPNPSAPYGNYTQMAFAHLKPGLPGLLFDQQFGLLASAPVLALALAALRPGWRGEHTRTWRLAWFVAALCLAYTCVVGAYRMWWGGLSAPARFLVPLVLPLAPFIALAWASLRTRASRHLAIALLLTSLAFTILLVVADHGALAYNVRDGRARWAVWVSPLVDLVAALPAAHRDAPSIVVRDAAVWVVGLVMAWTSWRVLERRRRLSALACLITLAVLVPAASAAVWAVRGVTGLAPAASQVRFVERQAALDASVLWTITPPPAGRTRNWFEVEIASRRSGAAPDFSLLRLDHLPAGRYRLFSTATAPGARLGLTLGEARAERFIAELTPETQASVAFTLPVPVSGVVVKGSREAAAPDARTWIQADEIWPVPGPAAARSHPIGDVPWLMPEDGIYPESGGAWLAGDADILVGVTSDEPQQVLFRAGGADVVVEWEGRRNGSVHLAAGDSRVVSLAPSDGRLRLRTTGGFRPAREPADGDYRLLGAWVAAP